MARNQRKVSSTATSRVLGEGHVASFPTRPQPARLFVWGYRVLARSYKDVISEACSVGSLDDIDVSFLRRTVDSVPKRQKACIQTGGSNFEHLFESKNKLAQHSTIMSLKSLRTA